MSRIWQNLYDVATAKVFAQIRAQLEKAGTVLADADLQIAATHAGNAVDAGKGISKVPCHPLKQLRLFPLGHAG